MSDSDEDFDWRPPTEAEKKILEARRERSNKISKLMGEYMLRGYRMLATTCPVCTTIELQDQQGRIYCVACSEVDSDENSKDNPVFSASAASHQIAEEVERQGGPEPSAPTSQVSSGQPPTLPQPPASTQPTFVPRPASSASCPVVQESLAAVLDKMQNAARALATTENVDSSRNLVGLIKECADCVLSLRQISPQS